MGGEEMVRLDKMEDSYKGMRENYWQGGISVERLLPLPSPTDLGLVRCRKGAR